MRKLLLAFMCMILSATSFAADKTVVRMETTLGTIELELYPEKAPKTVENFLRYTKEEFFNGTIYHRVIKGFMIQGGGFNKDYDRKSTHDEIPNEAFNGLKNDRGTIAMARTNKPHSATSQFFINTANNTPLNFTRKSMNGWGYAVFGKVIKGMNVVDKIEGVKTGPGGIFQRDAPQDQVVIKKVELVK